MLRFMQTRSQKSAMERGWIGSLEAEPPALKNFVFFSKNYLI